MVVTLTFKTTLLRTAKVEINTIAPWVPQGRDVLAFFVFFFFQENGDNWYIYLYMEESLPILFEDYKKLFKLQATLCAMLSEENQQIENIIVF